MAGVVKLLGIVMVVTGVVYFLKPSLMKKVSEFFLKDKWMQVGGILSIIIGLIFLGAASECAISWIVILFGLLALAKGVLIFALGKQKLKSMMDKVIKKPSKTLRGFALLAIALGVILIYSV